MIHWGWLLLDRFSTPLDWSRYPYMDFIFLCFAFFFPLCPQHLVFLFLVGLWFLVLLIPSISIFCLSPIMSFSFLCPLTIVSKRGRNLRIECLSSGGVIDLGGELYVKGKKVFYVTNLGGELVWYTLILILPPSHFVCPLFHFRMSRNIVLFLKIKVISLLMFLLYP